MGSIVTADAFTFSDVDKNSDSSFFVSYLNTISSMGWAKTYKSQTFEMMKLQQGHRVLDVGCGAGDDVRAMAELIASCGLAVGVDRSETMIQHARAASSCTNLSTEFYQCDAQQLIFSDDFFDASRSDRVLQHLPNPEIALQEMIRVTKPGGHIVVTDVDWETLVIDSADRATTRVVANFICDAIRCGWIGRQLPRMFKVAGLEQLVVSPATFVLDDFRVADQLLGLQRHVRLAQQAGAVSTEAAVRWIGEAKQASQTGCFLAATTGFGVCGRKPAANSQR
jgi:ubiquinone/menaquinone biosynthesis C-methylase UbiE